MSRSLELSFQHDAGRLPLDSRDEPAQLVDLAFGFKEAPLQIVDAFSHAALGGVTPPLDALLERLRVLHESRDEDLKLNNRLERLDRLVQRLRRCLTPHRRSPRRPLGGTDVQAS